MKTARDLSRFYVRTWATTLVATALVSVVASHLVYNWTASLPPGFYWLKHNATPRRSELVAFPIPADVIELVRDRRYLPDGAYIVKPVIGLPGDVVCTKGGVLTVNGETVGAVLTEDAGGRPLPHYDVCDRVPTGQLYVASHHPRSFDSRAFGPVSSLVVRGTVTPLWTY